MNENSNPKVFFLFVTWLVAILFITQCFIVGFNKWNKTNTEVSIPLIQETGELLPTAQDIFDTSVGKILFVSNRDGNNEIYVMNGDGSQQKRLTYSSANDVAPSWSPDATQIAFFSDRVGKNQIYIMDSDGNNQNLLAIQGTLISAPLWSPDGNWIAFSKTAENINTYLIKPNGSQEIQLTYNGGYNLPVAWSPNSKHVLLISNLDSLGQTVSVNNFFSLNIETGEMDNVTNYSAQYADASWSPNGRKIVYVSGRDSILILKDLLTNEGKILIANQLDLNAVSTPHEMFPDWLSDSQQIVFTWNKDGNDEIYIVDTLTGELRRLTNNPAIDFDPDWWSP